VAVDGGVVVGFATAITDGVLAAYIPLLEVLPSHQGLGIGTELIRTLLGQLDGHYMIDTACDDDVVGFYERLGFQRGNAMTRRDYAAQPGKKMTSLLDSGCL
jgi:ribosomal protein S18 acetylase RimI-like enzyme